MLPVYTELSNFETRVNGKKIVTDISIILIINSLSDPVNAINSIYQFLNKTRYKSEFILINLDKEGYKYDKLLAAFQVMRVLLPQNKITLRDAISLAVTESLSKNILFIDENCLIKSMNLEVLEMYLSESSFGMLIPLVVNEKDDILPNTVKGNINRGFLNTISTDIVGTAVSSIYPKYFCFIMNREVYLSRNIELSEYDRSLYTLLELGYRFWKEGFIINQVRNFKISYLGKPVEDISENFADRDYLLFNFVNFTDKAVIKGRWLKVLSIVFKSIFTFKFKNIRVLRIVLKNAKKNSKNNISKPVEDFAIFSIINRDIK